MKTIEQINILIKESTDQVIRIESENKKKRATRERNLISFYREVLIYLESKPKESLLKKQYESISNRIDNIVESFYPRRSDIDLEIQRQSYYRETGKKRLEKQLKTLHFLLY